MEYRYKGKTYHMGLYDDGKIKCHELQLEGDTAEEVQKKIREQVDKIRKAKTKDVIYYRSSWNGEREYIIDARSKCVLSDRGQVWVSWNDEGGDPKKEKANQGQIYALTNGNLEKIKTIIKLREQISELENQEEALHSRLETQEMVE